MKERKQAKCNKVANKWVKYYGAKCTDTCCISIAIWSLISVSCRCGRCAAAAAAPLSISFKSVEWMASLLVAFSFPRTQKHRLVCVFTHADLAVAFFLRHHLVFLSRNWCNRGSNNYMSIFSMFFLTCTISHVLAINRDYCMLPFLFQPGRYNIFICYNFFLQYEFFFFDWNTMTAMNSITNSSVFFLFLNIPFSISSNIFNKQQYNII